jgi:hypothetical protein
MVTQRQPKAAASSLVANVPSPLKSVARPAKPTVPSVMKPIAKGITEKVGSVVTKPTLEADAAKPKKPKVVRDSFTFPKAEYDQLAALKGRALALGLSIKKSELLRCGLSLLTSSSDRAFVACVNSLPKVKSGRPGK